MHALSTLCFGSATAQILDGIPVSSRFEQVRTDSGFKAMNGP